MQEINKNTKKITKAKKYIKTNNKKKINIS